jgi:hypothetical protein
MKIHPKYTPIIFAFFMSILMASLMSFVLTTVYTGFKPGLMHRWFHSFTIAWPVALPSIMIISPIVRKIVSSLVGGLDTSSGPKKTSEKPIGFVIFNIIFVGLLGYSVYLSSFVKSQKDSIKNLSVEISSLNKKVSITEDLKIKEVEMLSQITGITSKIDLQKEELDEIKGLIESYKKPTDKHSKH